MKNNKTILLTAMVAAVYLLHQDFWNWKKADPLVFGFLPIGLAYQAGYSILAAIMMAVLVKFAWPKELETELDVGCSMLDVGCSSRREEENIQHPTSNIQHPMGPKTCGQDGRRSESDRRETKQP